MIPLVLRSTTQRYFGRLWFVVQEAPKSIFHLGLDELDPTSPSEAPPPRKFCITSGAHCEGEFYSWRQVSILQVAKITTKRRYNTRKGKDPFASSSNAPPPTPVTNSRRGPQRTLPKEILLAENLPEQPSDELPLQHSEDKISELSRFTTPEPETPTTPSPQSASEPTSETLTSESSLNPSNTSADQAPEPPLLRMPPKPLPACGMKTAPSFDGKAGHLERYFRDIADTGQDTERTTDDELIQIAL
ncbi:hypothetical protein FB451DRAFT_1184762 [Mycena latifolia]|nr:hypothetical protein FB451DRAFT_1184762 [Mycena latifolia]